MSVFLITLIIAVLAVSFMFLGLAITRIVKGRDMESDVGNNRDMKARGLKCASQEMREAEGVHSGSCHSSDLVTCSSSCVTCEDEVIKK